MGGVIAFHGAPRLRCRRRIVPQSRKRKTSLWRIAHRRFGDRLWEMNRGKRDEGDSLREYRQHLVEAGQKASSAYDKAVMTLAGGALAVSFAFVRDVVGGSPAAGTTWRLGAGWLSLAFSLVAILSSMLTSQWALRRAIEQVDAKRIHGEEPGAWYSTVTSALNLAAGLGLILGVGFLLWFAAGNLSQLAVEHTDSPPTPPALPSLQSPRRLPPPT